MDPKGLVYTAILLGVLIFVHEFGHFIVAKLCGVKVLRFSIGFGPRIVGFTRGETEYRIAWIPLGGYVKMAGEQPGDEVSPEEAGRGFLAQPPWKRGLIVFAGPFFNLVFPIIVYFFVFVGSHQAISSKVGSVEPGLPAAAAGIKPGDRIVAVDGTPVRTFEEVREQLKTAYSHEVTLSVERDGKTFQTTLVPAKTVESNPVETVSRGMIGIMSVRRPPVLGVPDGSVAQAAGLATFDRVVQVNGKPAKDETSFNQAIAASGSPVTITVERDAPLPVPGAAVSTPKLITVEVPKQQGESYAAIGAESEQLYLSAVAPGSAAEKAGLAPGDKIVAINGTPLQSTLNLQIALSKLDGTPFTLSWRDHGKVHQAQVQMQKTEEKDEFGQVQNQFELGAAFWVPNAAEQPSDVDTVTVHLGVLDALARSAKIVPDYTYKTALGIAALFTGRVPFKSVGGPILIYQMTAKSAQAGLDSYLNLLALISINLGLVNLLPIPVLDGFALLAALWEGIRRRPIPIRAREIANMVGLVMLILLMVLVLKNDITR